MKTFSLKISSPEGDLFQGEAVKLCVRGSEGDLAILSGHIPFVTYVKPCDCRLELEDGTERVGHMESGVLTVGQNAVILLSGDFAWA